MYNNQLGNCKFCGANNLLSKNNKPYCSNKCWLKKQSQQELPADPNYAENYKHRDIQQMAKQKNDSIEKAHIENMRAASLDAASRIIAVSTKNPDDVTILAKSYLKFITSFTDEYSPPPSSETPF